MPSLLEPLSPARLTLLADLLINCIKASTAAIATVSVLKTKLPPAATISLAGDSEQTEGGMYMYSVCVCLSVCQCVKPTTCMHATSHVPMYTDTANLT